MSFGGMGILKHILVGFIIDREAREIIRLVASVRPSVCLFVCLSVCLWALSCLNGLTYDLDFWHEG